MTRLFMVNLYGTLLPSQGKLQVRRGFDLFLERHSSAEILLYGRKPEEEIQKDLQEAGLTQRVIGLEGMVRDYKTKDLLADQRSTENRMAYLGEIMRNQITPPYMRFIPPIERIARNHRIPISDIGIISHDHEDTLFGTQLYFSGTPTVFLVPKYTEHDSFSFEQIDACSWKHRAALLLRGIVSGSYVFDHRQTTTLK